MVADESAAAPNADSPSSEKSLPVRASSTVSEGAIKLVFPSETDATLGGESIGLFRVVNTERKRSQIDRMRIQSTLPVILESA